MRECICDSSRATANGSIHNTCNLVLKRTHTTYVCTHAWLIDTKTHVRAAINLNLETQRTCRRMHSSVRAIAQ